MENCIFNDYSKISDFEMTKPILLIVIDNLNKGGAEVLLVGILEELSKKFEIILVTLIGECGFENNNLTFKYRYILNSSNSVSFFHSLRSLKRIINKHRPDIIHSHLFYSSLISRISCPSNIPLIYSIHNEMSKNIFNRSKFLTFLEKNTIRRNHTLVAVSQSVLTDYEHTIKKVTSSFVIRNYISDNFFLAQIQGSQEKKSLRLVAVGNIKDQKNYLYLVEAFKLLQSYNISLDIYGNGSEKDINILQEKINRDNLPIYLKGKVANPFEVLHQYDLFVSSSKFEGFGIAPIEAMAMGLPLVLSDLPVYREITFNNALFFQIEDPNSFSELLRKILEGKYNLAALSIKGIEISKKYSKSDYIKNLVGLYDKLLIA